MSRSASSPAPDTASHDRAGSAWILEGWRARDRTAGATLDLTIPSSGIATPSGDRLLGFVVGGNRPPIDAWVRGDDVTATWEGIDERELRATGLWRAHHEAGGLTAWELVASATTRRLRADATLVVASEVAAAEVLTAAWRRGGLLSFSAAAMSDPELALIRRGDGRSVLLLPHPADLEGRADHPALGVATEGGRADVRCRLFPAGVEKGVLLRSRVFGAVGPTADDTVWAARLASRFAASPPLLST